jgi:hypothetical protein
MEPYIGREEQRCRNYQDMTGERNGVNGDAGV